MKTFGTLLAIGWLAGFQANAAPPSTNAVPAQVTVIKKQTRPASLRANPFAPAEVKDKNKIERAGKISSRPWTEIVGWHPGEPRFTDDLGIHEPTWCLFWIGVKPQP